MGCPGLERNPRARHRSEEHTSELQSLRHLVCRLLLEKKKKKQQHTKHETKKQCTSTEFNDDKYKRSIKPHERQTKEHNQQQYDNVMALDSRETSISHS